LTKRLVLTDAEERARALASAAFADCRSRCISDAARRFLGALLAPLSEDEAMTGRKSFRHGDRALAFAMAVEGFIGDLMLARNSAAAQGWVFRPLHASTFIDSDITRSNLSRAIAGLEFFGLIERAPRARRFGNDLFVSGTTHGRGGGTCFRATYKLAALARDSGVNLDSLTEHFHATRGGRKHRDREGVLNQVARKQP
jgi:hypothetical protein